MFRKLFALMLSLGVLGVFTSGTSFASQTYEVMPFKVVKKGKRKRVVSSKVYVYVYHPVKRLIARNFRLTGSTTFHGALAAGKKVKATGTLNIPVGKMVSGNVRRDSVMQAVLGVKKHPNITFTVTGIKKLAKPVTVKSFRWNKAKRKSVKCNAIIHGTFKINGKEKKVKIKAKVKKKGKRFLAFIPNLKLKCSTFGVKRPSMGFRKINDIIHLKMFIKLNAK